MSHRPPSGARRGGGGNATTSQGGRQEAAARQHVEAPTDRRWPLGFSTLDYEVLLADASLLSSADEARTELYDCARPGKVDACQFRSEEGDRGRGITRSTTRETTTVTMITAIRIVARCPINSSRRRTIAAREAVASQMGRMVPKSGKETETTTTET